MTPSAEVLEGDALERLAGLEARSFDAMLTDPPYGLAFMGKRWDYDVPSVELWREALRVLKPGAHALVACGTRTQHRMVVNLEDAGFHVRDVVAWIYGSGFPKSLDVSKAIDKAAGAERGEEQPHPTNACPGGRWCRCSELDESGRYSPTRHPAYTAPGSPEGERWSGYGTALKPAMELWTLVRRPLEGTVAANALEHGTGALNIDGCRIATNGERIDAGISDPANRRGLVGARWQAPSSAEANAAAQAASLERANRLGRWPANVTHDGSPEVVEHFPETVSRSSDTPQPVKTSRGHAGGAFANPSARRPDGHEVNPAYTRGGFDDLGSAARFFYCAKPDTSERDAGLAHLPVREVHRLGAGIGEGLDPSAPAMNRNVHPTVKPLALTAWLATMLLPPARDTPRRLLVPFAGSGSEMIGARLAGWDEVVGIELEPEYAEIARARILHHTNGRLW